MIRRIFIDFPEDQTTIDFDEIVYVQALSDRQRVRSQSVYNTYISLRHSGPLYLITAYDDVMARIHEVGALLQGDFDG